MAASDKVLGELHAAVATAFSDQVKGFTEIGEDGKERVIRPSPALLGAAVTFLKNNNITADVEGNSALRDLNEKLAARRNKKLPQAALDQAADAFSERFGGTLQ
jgi:hypothetical protein